MWELRIFKEWHDSYIFFILPKQLLLSHSFLILAFYSTKILAEDNALSAFSGSVFARGGNFFSQKNAMYNGSLLDATKTYFCINFSFKVGDYCFTRKFDPLTFECNPKDKF